VIQKYITNAENIMSVIFVRREIQDHPVQQASKVKKAKREEVEKEGCRLVYI